MATYAPSRAEILAIASKARLANTHPDAQGRIEAKVRQPPDDWELRVPYTVPGLVWTVESDTCATGRPNAPRNIAYDHYWHEFVYRQPADEAELVAIMSADSEEVFACYRFDGLERWTPAALDGWLGTTHDVVVGWLRDQLSTETDTELVEGLNEALSYLTSDDFREYVAAFEQALSARAGDTSQRRWIRKRRRA